MRILSLLMLLLMFVPSGQNPAPADDNSSVAVLSFKWSKSRQAIEHLDPAGTTAPAPAMIPANKNFARQQRINAQAGERDPNADSIDGRSAQLEKNVQEARVPAPKPVDGFAYRIKVQNTSPKVIEILFWEYQFRESSNPTAVTRRQFLCGIKIRPEKNAEVQAFSLSGPSDVINVATLAKKSGNPFEEKVVINRVEYADGSIWQRKDWRLSDVKLGYERALRTPWGSEMCRGL